MDECKVVNTHTQVFDVLIVRGTKWGNPNKPRHESIDERNRVCELFEEGFWKSDLSCELDSLIGKRLGCGCKLESKKRKCHGDFIANEVNKLAKLLESENDWEMPDADDIVKIYWHVYDKSFIKIGKVRSFEKTGSCLYIVFDVEKISGEQTFYIPVPEIFYICAK